MTYLELVKQVEQWLAAKSFAEIMGEAAESAHEKDRKAGHVPMSKPMPKAGTAVAGPSPFPSQAMRDGWGGFKGA